MRKKLHELSPSELQKLYAKYWRFYLGAMMKGASHQAHRFDQCCAAIETSAVDRGIDLTSI